MARREYSPEEKAAVLAALLSGQAIDYVAKTYSIPEGTIKAWKNRMVKPIREGVASVVTQKDDEEIADLLMQLTRAELRGLIAIAEHATNPDWLHLQGAESLGVFKGITHDKVFRMLEALGGGGARPDSDAT
jgi:transposase-like protein